MISVPFYRHGLGAEHAALVSDVISSPFLTTGGVARETETLLEGFFDIAGAKLANSWTNGAVATLLAMEIGPGDEVIVPAMTFVATANVVELVGATPIFVDVDPETLLIDIAGVARAVTPRTRAVIPVHLYGQMVDIVALRAALPAGLRIIEDAAHCFEGTLNGERPGRHSDAAIFSFYATKNVTCGEGGAIITGDADLRARLNQTGLHGMSAGAANRFSGKVYNHWDMECLGTKANLPDILAALLAPQIKDIATIQAARQRLAARYRDAFADIAGLRLVRQVAGGVSAEHLFPIAVEPKLRDGFMVALNEAGVATTVNYNPVHRTRYYRVKYPDTTRGLTVSENWGYGTISIPLFPGLTDQEQDHVISVVRRMAAQML